MEEMELEMGESARVSSVSCVFVCFMYVVRPHAFLFYIHVSPATYACHGGDDNHADVSDEKHHGWEYVDVDISKGILDAQVDEAVSHLVRRKGMLCM